MKAMDPVRVHVRYAETDQMGFVYHSNYLVYFDIARTEWIRQLWMPYAELEKTGLFMVVIDALLEFKTPALFDDVLTITAVIKSWSRAKLCFAYKIERESKRRKLICSGTTSHCLVDAKGRPQRMPDGLVNILRG